MSWSRNGWRNRSAHRGRGRAAVVTPLAAAGVVATTVAFLTPGGRTVDDPHGIGTTVVDGLDNRGDLVGFSVDHTGGADGFLGRP